MLKIENLHVTIAGREVLKGIDLSIGAGEVHAVMGPNGSGKSTLSYMLAGREGYEVTKGKVTFMGRNLLAMKPEERAAAGIFLAFQYPIEIPGVSTTTFLKTALNSLRKQRGEPETEPGCFLKQQKHHLIRLGMDAAMLKRGVNVGFSGGEKKRNEVLQMAMLEPKLAVLDETDSGLDIDALRIVSEGVNAMRSAERSFLVITHYQRLLDYIRPDVVHVLAQGKIQKTGGPELALLLEERGYADFTGSGEAA
ncbi:MAG: Fe-S cluster assembly ATPase SufC [Pseudomonadota bacterium]